MAKCYVFEIPTTDGKRYCLVHAGTDRPFHSGEWKTRKGAENYARKHGHELIEKQEDEYENKRDQF